MAGVVAIAGIIVNMASDPAVGQWGWEIFRWVVICVFVLMDFMTAKIALWAWRERGLIAWSLVFIAFPLGTLAATVALVLSFPALRDAPFVGAVMIFTTALVVQARQEWRQRRRETALAVQAAAQVLWPDTSG